MATYDSISDAVLKNSKYPALDQDLADHDFQRRRVGCCAKFVRKGDIVLDVACNTGYYWTYIPQAAEVHGVEVNPDHVVEARKRLTSVHLAPAESMPFSDRTFDVVNVSGLLEQVYSTYDVMREAARVSRRYVTGNTTHADGCWGKHRTERHLWQSHSHNREEITALLSSIGTIVELFTIDINTPPEPQCWGWCVRV